MRVTNDEFRGGKGAEFAMPATAAERTDAEEASTRKPDGAVRAVAAPRSDKTKGSGAPQACPAADDPVLALPKTR